ncbi:hypothetical protein NQ317_018767 [Molorchus minor]|uniref:Uncharacterized protein n=1 Tax=Molorchus minor TaxID=1323400 RepID=A0ABQ9J786_9CUCU|nr:hypothetical protein NQ317_018767 [Molorchus minor]
MEKYSICLLMQRNENSNVKKRQRRLDKLVRKNDKIKADEQNGTSKPNGLSNGVENGSIELSAEEALCAKLESDARLNAELVLARVPLLFIQNQEMLKSIIFP